MPTGAQDLGKKFRGIGVVVNAEDVQLAARSFLRIEQKGVAAILPVLDVSMQGRERDVCVCVCVTAAELLDIHAPSAASL